MNLIPGEARARFNIRYNDRHSQTALKALIEQRAQAAAAGRVRYTFEWQPSNADVFVTKPGPFTDLAVAAIAEVTGRKPKLSTTGGTSDARFIKDYCPVFEFGLVGQTMHRSTSARAVADLVTLTAIYRRIIESYFGAAFRAVDRPDHNHALTMRRCRDRMDRPLRAPRNDGIQ